MKNITKVISLLLVLVLAVGCFAACSNTTTNNETTNDSTTEAPAQDKVKVIDISLTDELYAFGVSKEQPELLTKANEYIAKVKEDGTLEKIINNYFGDGTPVPVTSAVADETKDQLVVATNAAFPPFESTEGDTYVGIDMELAYGLAEYLGKELVIMNIEFDTILSTVEAGYADIAIAGLTVNSEREKQVTFSDSYYTASQMVIVPADNTEFDACTTADDVIAILNNLTSDTVIGVQNGTTGQYYVEGDADWGFDGYKATCTGYDSGALAVTDMLNGNVDYVIIDEAPAKTIADAVNGK